MRLKGFDISKVISSIKGMDRGLAFSLGLHGVIIGVAVVGIPEFSKKPANVPPPMSVEIVNIAKERTVQKKAEEIQEEPEPIKKKSSYAREEAVSARMPDAIPTLKPSKPKKKIRKPKPKPKISKQQRIRTKIRPQMKPTPPKRFKSSKISELIDRSIKKEVDPVRVPEKKKVKPKAPKKVEKKKLNFDGLAGRLQAASIRDAISEKLRNCWTRPKGLKNSEDMAVPVRIYLNLQGDLAQMPELQDKDYADAAQSFKRVFGDSVIRAVTSCGKFEEAIPIIKSGNKYFDITFRPPQIIE